jgi:D-alanyl-D-alanine carboxypeptidase
MAVSPSRGPLRRILSLLLAFAVVGGAALVVGPRIAGAPVPVGPPTTDPIGLASPTAHASGSSTGAASPSPRASAAVGSSAASSAADPGALVSPAAGSSVAPRSTSPTTRSPTPTTSAEAPTTSAKAPTTSTEPTSAAPPSAAPPSAAPPSAAPPSATLARRLALDERLERLRWRAGIPGVSVAIIFPDGTTWLGQSGLADVDAGTPVSADTAFAVASITKTFTAAVVLDLVEDDLLELDGRVRTYLPDLDIQMDERTTVRQLLDHTSGLRDYFLDPRIDKALLADTSATWTAARAIDYVGKPYFRAGRGWHYSNTNYLVLGLLAEAVSGETLADLYRTRIIVPLGLDDTVYQPAATAEGPLARGYRFATTKRSSPPIDLSDGSDVVPFTSVVTAAAGAGGIAASAEDIARWARALYGGEALPPGALGAMLGGIERTSKLDPRVPYGLGVQAVEIDGRLSYGHSGRLLGFRATMRHFPAEGITIAVLTNQSRADPAVITRTLLQVALRPIERCLCTGRD